MKRSILANMRGAAHIESATLILALLLVAAVPAHSLGSRINHIFGGGSESSQDASSIDWWVVHNTPPPPGGPANTLEDPEGPIVTTNN